LQAMQTRCKNLSQDSTVSKKEKLRLRWRLGDPVNKRGATSIYVLIYQMAPLA